VTAKQLIIEFKNRGMNDWRRTKTVPRETPDTILRYGNSTVVFQGLDVTELNSREAVRNASNKKKMIEILSNAEKVRIPPLNSEGDGYKFYRNRHNVVEYRDHRVDGDKYSLDEINKESEFRIHVFNNHVWGVYEKIPGSPDNKIWKDDNSQFRRVDRSIESERARISGAQSMAKRAVNALGLLFGGVDIIKYDGRWYVLEVNSSPSLNSENVSRFVDLIQNYISNEGS